MHHVQPHCKYSIVIGIKRFSYVFIHFKTWKRKFGRRYEMVVGVACNVYHIHSSNYFVGTVTQVLNVFFYDSGGTTNSRQIVSYMPSSGRQAPFRVQCMVSSQGRRRRSPKNRHVFDGNNLVFNVEPYQCIQRNCYQGRMNIHLVCLLD